VTQHATGAVVPAYHAVLREVAAEREAQDEKWGEQNHPNGTGGDVRQFQADMARAITDAKSQVGTVTYSDILTEEFYEALAEDDPRKLRAELVQVAAVAVAWIEKIDREASRVG
jgi:hypothetical protein